MRVMATPAQGFEAKSYSGTHTVLVALNCTEKRRKGLMGFAFEREMIGPGGGGPKWLREEKWDITAKEDAETVAAIDKMTMEQRRAQFRTMVQADVPQGRNGKHKLIVTTIVKDLDQLPAGAALKVPLAELAESKEKVRSALNRATRKAKRKVATATERLAAFQRGWWIMAVVALTSLVPLVLLKRPQRPQ